MPEQHYRPETYVPHESVGYLVRRLYTLLLSRFEAALAHEHFTLTQWIVLAQLREGRVRTASDIAHDLGHDTGALTRVIDQLARRGLVARRRSQRDRRVVQLELTQAGHAMVRALLPVIVDQTNDALTPLTAAEFSRLREYLVRLVDHAQAGTAVPTPDQPLQEPAAARGKPGKTPARLLRTSSKRLTRGSAKPKRSRT
jgi:DNA-binding MarR family transcriptional regulator